MNSVLFGAVSIGLMVVSFTKEPANLEQAARHAADDAEVARLMEAAPDEGSLSEIIVTDPETGEQIKADVLAFRD